MPDLVVLLLGVVCAGIGGELFVRGAVGLASWARVPAAVVGTTVAAFATSSPELSVAVQASLDGKPAIALGDALGSNVINVAVVLGLTLVLGPLAVARADVRRELAVAAMAPVLTLAVLIDGRMARAEAAVLMGAFVAWLVVVTRQALRQRSVVDEVVAEAGVDALVPSRRWGAVGAAAVGLGFLVLAGTFIVDAAKGIGDSLGMDPFVVGATLVALGTSTPELATAIISRARGHSEVGLGTVLGSNVFNNLWIVGVAGLITPIDTAASEVLLAVGACLVALALVVPPASGTLGRGRGLALVAVAAAYAAATVILGPS